MFVRYRQAGTTNGKDSPQKSDPPFSPYVFPVRVAVLLRVCLVGLGLIPQKTNKQHQKIKTKKILALVCLHEDKDELSKVCHTKKSWHGAGTAIVHVCVSMRKLSTSGGSLQPISHVNKYMYTEVARVASEQPNANAKC